ncbi:hypothetical protein AVEN_271683-1 [Araneus ventricosus]|uniref:Sushi domain-containing protein n=1 Tax=Araneus ventricosus TaxID=182803 RepID=A0A4Y2J800_ARAVE|nr:hypothetical protein AVEN_271683-1 [Araneus ventricosus]
MSFYAHGQNDVPVDQVYFRTLKDSLIYLLTSLVVECPKLQKPWNGQIIGTCETNVGDQCVFECRDPYNLVGSRVRVCQENGTWTGETSACGKNQYYRSVNELR